MGVTSTMVSFTFVITTEPYKFQAIDSLLNLSKAILDKGHEIKGFYFFGSGVYNIKKDADTGTLVRNLPERLEKFCSENKIQMGGCSTWLSFTGMVPEEFIQGACVKGLGELSEWAEESDKLIVFGTGG